MRLRTLATRMSTLRLLVISLQLLHKRVLRDLSTSHILTLLTILHLLSIEPNKQVKTSLEKISMALLSLDQALCTDTRTVSSNKWLVSYFLEGWESALMVLQSGLSHTSSTTVKHVLSQPTFWMLLRLFTRWWHWIQVAVTLSRYFISFHSHC